MSLTAQSIATLVRSSLEPITAATAGAEWKGDDGDNEINASPTEIQTDHMYGYDGHDILRGYAGTDILDGGAGNDILDGGTGLDKLYGGDGDDTYHVDHLGDQVLEQEVDTGVDTVVASTTWILRNSNIEFLVASNELVEGKPRNINLIVSTGGDTSQTLIGNDGNNLLDGGTGIDTLRGGKGDDTYRILHYKDVIEELADEGTDKIISLVNFTLGAGTHVEVLELAEGRFVGSSLTGNELGNRLIGNSLDNTLDGGAGKDALAGGSGDDLYIIDHALDAVEEIADQGNDKAVSSVSYTLGAGVHVEILAAASGKSKIELTGNELNNTLVGNDGDNVLAGGSGADMLDGGAGMDWVDYSSGKLSVDVDLQAGKGHGGEAEGDIYSSIENARGSMQADRLLGNANGNVLCGEAGNDILDGGAGSDRMEGGSGSDTYFVDEASDRVFETAAGGNADTIITSVSCTLAHHVENLVASGSSALTLTGNSLNNTILGNEAKNRLNGGHGNDKLDGGFGSDVLNGGSGKDAFVFKDALSKARNMDKIVGFDVKDDTIYLDNAVFKKLGGSGKLKKAFFTVGDKAAGKNDFLVYKQSTGELFYDSDGAGRCQAVLFAKMSVNLKLTADDFRVI